MVSIIKAHGLTICFPGDMEVSGWRNLLNNSTFCSAIGEVNVFVASHHGRQNGCCDELFAETGLYPTVTIISDAGIQYASQETVAWYRSRTRGMTLNGDTRHVLTTRRDGRVAIEALPNSTTLQVGV